MPLPPLDEQVDVVRRIAVELSRPNTAISRLEREIELLREYRTRLISDVVTGKLDVRVAAEWLPEPPTDAENYHVNEDVNILCNAEDTEFEDSDP